MKKTTGMENITNRRNNKMDEELKVMNKIADALTQIAKTMRLEYELKLEVLKNEGYIKRGK